MSAVRRLNVFLAGLFFPFAAFSPFDYAKIRSSIFVLRDDSILIEYKNLRIFPCIKNSITCDQPIPIYSHAKTHHRNLNHTMFGTVGRGNLSSFATLEILSGVR